MMNIYTQRFESEEQGAVVSARTSRSPNTFDVIRAEVEAKGHQTFLKTNVLGYGHDSVAEVAQVPLVCIEDVSDLAANIVAIADPQLVVQMSSTRYQDMSTRRVVDKQPGALAGVLMKAKYMAVMPAIEKILETIDHPKKRTLQCDIARAHLPAGISTQLSIRGNARVMRDAVAFMLGHELPEVQRIGAGVQEVVKNDIEVLFDRHIVPAPSKYMSMSEHTAMLDLGYGNFVDIKKAPWDDGVLDELKAWRDSGWRRRMRINAAPFGPFWRANLCTDYGGYRDLRRNRTLHQSDFFPSAKHLPIDPLWAFRKLYPELCQTIEQQCPDMMSYVDNNLSKDDPYLAPMGSCMMWAAGGHIFNWAYALRLRSWADSKNPKAGCHPAYAIPMRNLMKQILDEAPVIAEAMGIVSSMSSFMGVEFSDRVPA